MVRAFLAWRLQRQRRRRLLATTTQLHLCLSLHISHLINRSAAGSTSASLLTATRHHVCPQWQTGTQGCFVPASDLGKQAPRCSIPNQHFFDRCKWNNFRQNTTHTSQCTLSTPSSSSSHRYQCSSCTSWPARDACKSAEFQLSRQSSATRIAIAGLCWDCCSRYCRWDSCNGQQDCKP